jgi:hypothetical protein
MDKEIFTGEQKVIERYGDLIPCGQCGAVRVDEKGNFAGLVEDFGGTLFEETVKYVGEDGKIKLGKDWTTGE